MAENPYRIAHISDLHLWHFVGNPVHWIGKRGLGLMNLAIRRARRFKREELPTLLEALEEDEIDHLIISGDLTTTSLESEFREVQALLSGWTGNPSRATIVPGNHDRYTRRAYRNRFFEQYFGDRNASGGFPFRKTLSPGLDLIGFDPNVPRPFSARGLVDSAAVDRLRDWIDEIGSGDVKVLLFVCHYPAEVPARYASHEKGHELVGAPHLLEVLETLPVPVYWLHGHLHYPWRYQSPRIKTLTYLNPGAPLLEREKGISLGRWILEWDGSDLHCEWRSRAGTEGYLEEKPR